MRIFDVHSHYPAGSILGIEQRIGRETDIPEPTRQKAVEALVAQCEALDIIRLCLFGGWGRVNDWVLEAARRFPDLIVPIAFLDLDCSLSVDIRRLKDIGFQGVKIIFPRRNYDDPVYMPLYAQLCDLGMPILFHTGYLGGKDDYLDRLHDPKTPSPAAISMDEALSKIGTSSARMRPSFLDTIAMAFPELRIVGAHLGYGEYETACAVARWRRNVYFDLSGGEVVRRHLREKRLIPTDVRPDKLVFGSDCACSKMRDEVESWQTQLKAAGLDDVQIDKIMYSNAAWLFNMD